MTTNQALRNTTALFGGLGFILTASLFAGELRDLPADSTASLGQEFIDPQPENTTRVLLAGSGDHHHFPRYFLADDSETLRAAGDIDTAAALNLEETLELLPHADVLVFSGNHQMFGDDRFQQALRKHASQGKGVVLVHAAVWRWDWNGYNERFVGGGSRGHGFGEIEVTVENPDHPVMADVPETFNIVDESYHHEFFDDADVEVLAENGPDDHTGRPHASVWVVNDPETRIVCVTFGHDGRAHGNPAYRTILTNAVNWVADAPAPETAEEAPIRALYVTGGGYHDYGDQETIITEALAERLNVDLTIDFEAGTSNSHQLTRLQETDWHEDFDAVIYNMCFASVTDVEYIEGITKAHYESGTAALVIHCAMHSFRDAETDAWNHLIGLRTYHHERAQREVTITPVALDHPIMAEFPDDKWLSPRDEIYIVEETYDNMTPLALAYGPETERDHPVMWVNRYGNARVVGTTAGHNNEVIEDPVFLDFLTRGLLWSVGRLGTETE